LIINNVRYETESHLEELSILETELKEVPVRVAAFSRPFLEHSFGASEDAILKCGQDYRNFSFARKQYMNCLKSDNFFSV
jgi:hypothetical protein